jgi:hypothetical protein
VLLNDHEAEDVVQEKFIRAFTGLASFRGESSLSTWLTRIALNESRRRKHGRRRQFGLKVLDFSSAQRDAQIHDSSTYQVQDPERATGPAKSLCCSIKSLDSISGRSHRSCDTAYVRSSDHANRGISIHDFRSNYTVGIRGLSVDTVMDFREAASEAMGGWQPRIEGLSSNAFQAVMARPKRALNDPPQLAGLVVGQLSGRNQEL